jgi:hypothetical protein
MLIQDDRLTMAVNREGFLALMPWHRTGIEDDPDTSIKDAGIKDSGGLALYRIADAVYWKNYTLGSFFLYEGNPAALLYRDDFFIESTVDPPAPRVFALVKGQPHPRGLGEAVSLGAFRDSALPEPLHEAPPLLALVLDKAYGLSGPDPESPAIPVATVISPEFSHTRHFAADTPLPAKKKPCWSLQDITAGPVQSGNIPTRPWYSGWTGNFREDHRYGGRLQFGNQGIFPALPAGGVCLYRNRPGGKGHHRNLGRTTGVECGSRRLHDHSGRPFQNAGILIYRIKSARL